MTPTKSFEVLNGTQSRRGDFNRPEEGRGLHSSPEGVRSHLLPVGCPSPDQAGLVGDLSLGTRRGARQATSDSGSRSPEAYRSLDDEVHCPHGTDCSFCAMLAIWSECQDIPEDESVPMENAAFL